MNGTHGLSQPSPAFRSRVIAVCVVLASLAGCANWPAKNEVPADAGELLESSLPVAAAALAAGQFGVARRLYLSLSERFEDAPDPFLGLGYIALQSGDLAAAESDFLEAAERATEEPALRAEALLGAGRAALSRDRPRAAARHFREARAPAQGTPFAAWIANGVAVAATLRGDHEEAEAHYVEALRLSSDNPRIAANYIRMLVAAERPGDAGRTFERFPPARWPDDEHAALSRLIADAHRHAAASGGSGEGRPGPAPALGTDPAPARPPGSGLGRDRALWLYLSDARPAPEDAASPSDAGAVEPGSPADRIGLMLRLGRTDPGTPFAAERDAAPALAAVSSGSGALSPARTDPSSRRAAAGAGPATPPARSTLSSDRGAGESGAGSRASESDAGASRPGIDSRTGAPLSDAGSRTGAPLSDTGSRTGAPLSDTESRTRAPLSDTESRTRAPLSDTESRTRAPLPDTESRTGAPPAAAGVLASDPTAPRSAPTAPGAAAPESAASGFTPPVPGTEAGASGLESPDHASPPALTLPLGQSRRIHLEHDATTVLVAAPEVADVQLLAPDVLYVIGKGIGRTSVTVLQDDERIEERVIAVVLDLEPSRTMLAGEPDLAGVRARRLARGVALTGEVASTASVDRALRLVAGSLPEGVPIENELRVAGPQQVNLEVQIAEVHRSVTEDLGVNWEVFRIRGEGDGSFGFRVGRIIDGFPTTQIDGWDAPSVRFERIGARSRIGAMIDALSTAGLANVLARPNVTAVSGESASFFSGGERPIPSGYDSRTNTILFEYKKVGVLLDFVPTVVDSGRIVLTVRPEVSEPDASQPLAIGPVLLPVINVRRAETTVEVGDGESIVIAGLFRNQSSTTESGLPGFKDVPLLGLLFGTTSIRSNELELIVVVTARLVRPNAAPDETAPPPETLRMSGYHY